MVLGVAWGYSLYRGAQKREQMESSVREMRLLIEDLRDAPDERESLVDEVIRDPVPGLLAKLSMLADESGVVTSTVTPGDLEPPYGNGDAQCVVVLALDGDPRLRLRIAFDDHWSVIIGYADPA